MTSYFSISPKYYNFTGFDYSGSLEGFQETTKLETTESLQTNMSTTVGSPLGRVNCLLPIERAKFMPRWSALVIKIHVVLAEMAKIGCANLEIEAVSDALYTELYLKAHQFLDRTAENRETCRDRHIRAEDFDQRLQQISLNYPDFTLSAEIKPPSTMSMIRGTNQPKLKCDAPSKMQFPSTPELYKCIREHPQTKDAYFLDKGIVDRVVSMFSDQEKTREGIELGVMFVLDEQDQLSDQTTAIVHNNIRHALEDCTK